jgi:scyllo-inositol 2-dehydrogenase (NADP+)
MSEKIDGTIPVGIVGLGRAGWSLHALTLESMPDKYRVAAACDMDEGRLKEARERLGCHVYNDYADLLADDAVELVVVAMPSHLHADFAIRAMRAGKDVLIEKPFASDLSSADKMIQVAKETGRILTGSQNLRYTADFLKVRQIIDSGRLGNILLIRMAWHWFRRRWDWQTLKEFGGGSLNNDGSHVIDQALLLFGDAEPQVFCHMVATPLSFGDAEDHVKIILQAEGVPMIDMEFSNACAYPQDSWLIMGTQGGLTGTHGKLSWKYVDPELLIPRQVSRQSTPDRSYNREELPWIEEACNFPSENYTASNKRLYLDLYRTLRKGAPLAITPESIRRQIYILEKCRQISNFDQQPALPAMETHKHP